MPGSAKSKELVRFFKGQFFGEYNASLGPCSSLKFLTAFWKLSFTLKITIL